MTGAMAASSDFIAYTVLLLLSLLALSAPVSGTCCATCLSQTDPKTTTVTYDPLVHSECSVVSGICCYSCSFSHGDPTYSKGVSYSTNGKAQATAGTTISFTFSSVSSVTYEFLQTNQQQTNFVTNASTAATKSGSTFSICVDEAGTIRLRGWGADECSQVTTEYTIAVVASSSSTTCDSASASTVTSSSDSTATSSTSSTATSSTSSTATSSTSSTATSSTSSTAASGTSSRTMHGSTASSIATVSASTSGSTASSGTTASVTSCSSTRGVVKTNSDGTKYCACTGDWRNPPECDKYSYTRLLLTIGGGVATVLSIVISVRICLKNRNTEKEAAAAASNDKDEDNDSVDILSPRIAASSSATAAAATRTPVGIQNPTTPAVPVPVQVQVSKSKPEFTL